jgi:protein O-GlcNAc transferase
MTDTINTAVQAFNDANGIFKTGDWRAALIRVEECLGLDASLVPAHLLRARCLVRLGEWMAAREAFAQTLRLAPTEYSAWLEAGHLCRQMGELQQAAMSYQRAIDVAPTRYEAVLSIARVLAQQGQFEVAERAYADASNAALTAPNADAPRLVHAMMGQYWLEQGQPSRAIGCFTHALRVIQNTPGIGADVAANQAADVQMDWATALLRMNQRDAAMRLLTFASAATSEATLSRLVELSYHHNFWQEAIEIARRCVALYPSSANAYWNLAHLLVECWKMEEALEALDKAEALGAVAGARSLRAAAAGKTGDVDRTLDLYLALAHEDASFASSAAMSSLYSDKLSVQAVADLHRALFAKLGEGARDRASFVRAPLQGRRVRVGIVSADFHHQHPVNIFMQPVLREMDASRFEVFMYFNGESHDAQTALARQRVAHWVEATALNDTQLAKRIEADAIDVLIDMAGHTNKHRMAMFAKRAAPVQMTYLGYPGSTGVPNMDYIVGDSTVTPEGCEGLYSEQVLRLPGTVFCYAPEEHYPDPVWTRVDTERPLTFGSFNNVPKLTPRTLALWARVLAEVPESRLVLKAPSFGDEAAVRAFGKRLRALGVDPQRVTFRGPVGLSDMMAEYADIDIALDPVPYNGGTTSLQAMWMGVPVVTQLGGYFVSRMGASFMTAAGLPEWVANDDDGYVAVAKRMAADRAALWALKRGLRERLLSLPAWDVVAHTRAFEALISHAVENH